MSYQTNKKIVINNCFGGFSLSDEAKQYYATLANINLPEDTFFYYDLERDDPALVQTVEILGEAANGSCARLRVVEIPSDVKWEIEEFDGAEQVVEAHRKWS